MFKFNLNKIIMPSSLLKSIQWDVIFGKHNHLYERASCTGKHVLIDNCMPNRRTFIELVMKVRGFLSISAKLNLCLPLEP